MSQESDLKKVLESIGDLVLPLEKGLPPGGDTDEKDNFLDSLLRQKCSSLEKCLTTAEFEEEDVRWKFVLGSLELLRGLDKALQGGDLSIGQERDVSALLQFCVSLGILPYLIPGVGLPAEKRSTFSALLMNSGRPPPPLLEKHKKIVCVITQFLQFENKKLKNLILTKNFGDILAALIQLSYAPLKKPSKDSTTTEETMAAVDNKSFVMSEELYAKLIGQQEDFRRTLQDFMESVYQPLLVKYLLVIQSGGTSPKWLKNVVGELLSDRLMKKNGVLNIIRGVLDIAGDGGALDPRKYRVIAGVLASPPSSFSYNKMEDYYALICPQVLHIMNLKDETMEKTYHLIACACVRSITERSLILSRRYFLDPLFEPFYTLGKGSIEGITEQVFEKSIQDIHLLFVVGNDPSIVFINHLEPIILVLLDLHRSINFGVSHLRTPVKELITRYLKYSTMSHSLKIIRMFAFRDIPEKKRMLLIDDQLIHFIPGDNGGIVPKVIKSYEESEQGNFYVQDDEKSIVLSDIVEDISKEMTMEFFMSLVGDLTEIMSLYEFEDDFASKLDISEATTEEKLLKLESDMEVTMTRLRKNLMVIRLLGLMSEDSNLQDNLSKNSSRLISFVSMTIERAAILTKKRDKNTEINFMEVQSLNMALTILSVHLTQKDISLSSWKELQVTLDPLKLLSESYSDERVRRTSGQLRNLIATHGAIIDYSNEMKANAEKINQQTNKINDAVSDYKKLLEETPKVPKTPYSEALFNLTDPLLPVRAAGIISLTRLLEDGDDETCNNLGKVTQIFKDNLEDDDSYVYLSAIKGLVVAGYRSNSSDILELLIKEYLFERKSFDKNMEVKTKIGEALVRITSCLGEMTVKHKNLLFNAFLNQSSHTDELVRTSAYSNMGQVCKNLKYGLGDIIQEVNNNNNYL